MAISNKSRQAQNYFRQPTPTKNSGVIGEGRYKDVRYRIVRLRNEFLAVYIGLTDDNSYHGATTAELGQILPEIQWTYASPDLTYASKTKENIWWIGWVDNEALVGLETQRSRLKSVINELSKGALSGEIGTNH